MKDGLYKKVHPFYLFYPEDRGSMFLWNIKNLCHYYVALQSRRRELKIVYESP
jgi:hypothetical protein